MKIFIVISILSVFVQSSFALTCYGCEIRNSKEVCDFTYKCPKGTDFCETLVSKVEGNYSVILSCSTREKCGMSGGSLGDDDLANCEHSRANTECFSCCDDSKCNDLESAMSKLPNNMFEEIHENLDEDEKQLKGEKEFLRELEEMIEEDEKKLENGEDINETTIMTYDEQSTVEIIEAEETTEPAEFTTQVEETTQLSAVNETNEFEVEAKTENRNETLTTAESVEEPTTILSVTEVSETNSTEDVLTIDEVTITELDNIFDNNETVIEDVTTPNTNVTVEEVENVIDDHHDDDDQIDNVDLVEDFSAEHHALTDSSSIFKPTFALLAANILFIIIKSFVV